MVNSNPSELVPPFSGCVGFTFFDHVFGDRNVAQCCFLRRATRWQPNFRRATCHLARGAMTRSGCFCQAGTMWKNHGDITHFCLEYLRIRWISYISNRKTRKLQLMSKPLKSAFSAWTHRILVMQSPRWAGPSTAPSPPPAAHSVAWWVALRVQKGIERNRKEPWNILIPEYHGNILTLTYTYEIYIYIYI